MKRALSIGINYPGTSSALRGCVNDSRMIETLLRTRYGFEDITLLLDNEATTDNMRKALNKLVDSAVTGDVLFFHYSGHGSQVFNQKDDDDIEPDGLDEIICPVDLDWKEKMIRDDELKEIFDRVPNGVNLTVFLDCCNSGGGMDHLNQYQSLAPGEKALPRSNDDGGRYLRPPQEILDRAKKMQLPLATRTLSRNIDHSGLMISGCQANQTSADAYIDGEYRGAATYYLNKTLSTIGYDATYLALIDRMNKDLAAAGFSQRPELNGPERLFDQWFLGDHTNLEFVQSAPAPAPAPVKDDGDKDDKKKKTLMLVVGVAIAAAIAYFAL